MTLNQLNLNKETSTCLVLRLRIICAALIITSDTTSHSLVCKPMTANSGMMAAGQPAESSILAILYCEFHAHEGPKILYQAPENFMAAETFQSLNAYIIPKIELQGRLITVNSLGYKILGFPVGIDNKKYTRNRLVFNLCFVCETSKRTVQYEPLVKKLARYFINLEVENSFLSDEESKAKLPEILRQIRDQLNSKERSCCVKFSEYPAYSFKCSLTDSFGKQCRRQQFT